MSKTNKFCAAVLVAAFPWLTGCETFGGVYSVPEHTIASGEDQAEVVEEALPKAAGSEEEPRPGFERLSPLPTSGRGLAQEDWSDRFADDDEIRVAVEDMPLSQFLHYAFGELLGVNYLIADGLTNLEAPITLNLQDSVSSRRLYAVATELLAGRDVGVTFRDDIYYLHPVALAPARKISLTCRARSCRLSRFATGSPRASSARFAISSTPRSSAMWNKGRCS
jgi:hypothetical protein